ncbi:MAG: ATP-binding protein [Clostridiales bacterium]|nr:ATP-binding protein [Clostridiales bacterium]
MGILLNPSSIIFDFEASQRSIVNIDKSGLISHLNKVAGTSDRYICISRPRRFGKTWAASMLSAYYSKGCDARKFFERARISLDPSFETHLNRFDVVFLNIQNILTEHAKVKLMISSIKKTLLEDLRAAYPEVKFRKPSNLIQTLTDIKESTGNGFVFIIDEWDCIFRVLKNDFAGQRIYLDFLRSLLKNQGYVHLAYMTGILPIKKYGTHSALNMFYEFSMANPGDYAEFTGFTEKEVESLFSGSNMSFELAKYWYDGFVFNNVHIYNPLSIVKAVITNSFENYWNQTETFEALKMPISLNFDGLKDAILRLMTQGPVKINTTKFQNDMASFSSADDVLTLLVHLGYLAFNKTTSEVSIPNNEIREEFKNAVESAKWAGVSRLLLASEQLLNDTWSLNALKIKDAIQAGHNESTSILKYNDENSLCCVVSLAYYTANEYYIIFRELASGKGFIDMLFLPKPQHYEKPALIVELKWNKSAKGAIDQVKSKNYPQKILQYTGKILLVGINYDSVAKEHSCIVEELIKI